MAWSPSPCCPWNSLSKWGWQHPCPYPSVPGKATSYSTRWSLACPLGWNSCHLQTEAVQWSSFDFVARIVEFGALSLPFSLLSHPFPSPSPSPFSFPFHFSFPLFFPLPSSVSCSVLAGEGKNQPQPLLCLMSCSY